MRSGPRRGAFHPPTKRHKLWSMGRRVMAHRSPSGQTGRPGGRHASRPEQRRQIGAAREGRLLNRSFVAYPLRSRRPPEFQSPRNIISRIFILTTLCEQAHLCARCKSLPLLGSASSVRPNLHPWVRRIARCDSCPRTSYLSRPGCCVEQRYDRRFLDRHCLGVLQWPPRNSMSSV